MLSSKDSRNIFLCLFFLSGLGLVQVYSSSFLFAIETYGNGLFFFNKQLIFSLIAWLAFFIVAFIPWKYNRYFGMLLWFFAVLLLILTLFPQTSISVGGARRWIQLPFSFRFQPSELLKVTTPFLLAWLLVLKEQWPGQKIFFWFVPFFSIGFPIIILILQPDFGTIILLCALVSCLIFILGLPWLYFILGMSVISSALFYFATSTDYRLARLSAFLNPWADPSGQGFQVIQSLLGVHSGGLFGVGLGKGQSKLFFLPEAHTDFTLAVFAEETGFIGLSILFAMYGFLIYSGWRLSLRIHDFYEKVLSFSLIFVFAISVFIHCSVNLSLLPTKGLALPFLSYGGSSLLCTFLLFGWIMSIERNNRLEY
ncbi:MAG: putative peptidoglycan glycosyltransferase FtsW [Bdellovibrionaceae bacterium]|nr:putative peptidoglycan glycosyltransferase FtsW [Pseudobdellovibrionaceae bacterium]